MNFYIEILNCAFWGNSKILTTTFKKANIWHNIELRPLIQWITVIIVCLAVNVGSWFYEVTINEMPGDSATRIGWSQRLGMTKLLNVLLASCLVMILALVSFVWL